MFNPNMSLLLHYNTTASRYNLPNTTTKHSLSVLIPSKIFAINIFICSREIDEVLFA